MITEKLGTYLSLYDYMILNRIDYKETLSAETILNERTGSHRWPVDPNKVLDGLVNRGFLCKTNQLYQLTDNGGVCKTEWNMGTRVKSQTYRPIVSNPDTVKAVGQRSISNDNIGH